MLKLPIASRRGLSRDGRKTKLEIPEKALPIVKRLSSKYSLDIEFVKVAGKGFYFLHVADLIPLLSENQPESAPDFPFWVKIWEASLVLAEFVAKMPPRKGQRILELGAGLSVPGMVASSFGHDVVVTDYEDEIMDFVRASAIINNCENLKCERLDWFEPRDLGLFDVILGSELLFHPRFFDPLYGVLKDFLAPGGVIYFSHAADRQTLMPFFKMCQDEFQIAMQKKHFKNEEKEMDILLTRLTRKVN